MLVIEEKQLDKFIGKIKKRFDFFDARNDILPFKQYFMPAIQEIFSSDKKNDITEAKTPKDFIVFGLNQADLEALTQLDEIMKRPFEDSFYFQRRDRAIVIGLTKKKIEIPRGGDAVFEKINNNRYKVWTQTPKGEKLVKKNKKFFKEVKKESSKALQTKASAWSKSMKELLSDSETLSDAIEWSRNHKIWDELKERCLGCGICTYVCPLCYCFSIEDHVSLDGACRRCRKWDACTLPAFSRIAGGHSFRPTLKERYYNWFYHKFVRAYKEYGKSQCVGCERCKKYCPAKIDIKEILLGILEDYKKVISNK